MNFYFLCAIYKQRPESVLKEIIIGLKVIE